MPACSGSTRSCHPPSALCRQEHQRRAGPHAHLPGGRSQWRCQCCGQTPARWQCAAAVDHSAGPAAHAAAASCAADAPLLPPGSVSQNIMKRSCRQNLLPSCNLKFVNSSPQFKNIRCKKSLLKSSNLLNNDFDVLPGELQY